MISRDSFITASNSIGRADTNPFAYVPARSGRALPGGDTEMTQTRQTIELCINPSEETIRIGALSVRFLITGENSAGSIAVFELTVPGTQRLAAPAHSHDAYEETIYGIKGVLTWTVDGKQINVGPGQALCIPRGAIHRFDNNGVQDATALCAITPAVIGPDYFREAAELINAAGGGPPDPAKVIEIMLRHGLTPAPFKPQG
jgi:quercetin dioxygenase-like cupin family protein